MRGVVNRFHGAQEPTLGAFADAERTVPSWRSRRRGDGGGRRRGHRNSRRGRGGRRGRVGEPRAARRGRRGGRRVVVVVVTMLAT